MKQSYKIQYKGKVCSKCGKKKIIDMTDPTHFYTGNLEIDAPFIFEICKNCGHIQEK
jgi:hypothetical protein